MNKLLIVLLSFLLIACTSQNEAVKLSTLASKPENVRTKKVAIPLSLYQETLAMGGVKNRSRMIEVFSRGGSNYPRYRFFDIKRGSVLDLLEIKNSDILVTANGFVVPDQEAFWKYLNVLHLQKEAFIEIDRRGSSLLLEYIFKK